MTSKTSAIARGVALIGGTAALIVSATFAAFTTNQVTLANNTLSVNGDQLRIFDNVQGWTTATTGFNFTLNPGLESAKQPFYLQNNSGASIAISAQLENPVNYVGGFNNASLITVNFYDGQGFLLATTNLAALGGPVALIGGTGGTLAPVAQGNSAVPSTPGNYQISFKVAPGGVNGNTASANSINIGFTGTSVTE